MITTTSTTNLGQFVVVNEIWPVTMDKCTESKTVLPAHVEVLDIHILIRSCFSLTPQQETFLSRRLCVWIKKRQQMCCYREALWQQNTLRLNEEIKFKLLFILFHHCYLLSNIICLYLIS